jgi:titin
VAYTAYSYSTQDPVVHSASVDGAASSSVVVTGLINGFQYRFYVTASNFFGESQPSAYSPEITPIGPPTPPLNVVATAGPGNAVVTWDAPESTGGSNILGYVITSDPPGYTQDVNASPLQVLATPLISGISYTFTLVATNTKGLSLPSAPSNPVIPLAPPDPPTNVAATPGNASADITWDYPINNGGSPILSYTVTSSPGNIILLSVQSPTLFQNLINGTSYTFTVYSTNQIGDSILSIPSLPVTPATFPDYPLNPFAVAGNGEAQVSWDAPESNGGSPIINYTVITEPATTGPQTTLDDSTTLLVTGLTNGTSYTFTVYATNIMGNSFISVPTQPVTPS